MEHRSATAPPPQTPEMEHRSATVPPPQTPGWNIDRLRLKHLRWNIDRRRSPPHMMVGSRKLLA
eukprot:9117431-Pyramimonas_sp.AAC.3